MRFRSNESESVSVIGCGYIGLPLARRLVYEGYEVRGSTTSPEKRRLIEVAGIDAFLLDLADGLTDEHAPLLASEIIVLNIPPGRKDQERRDNYPQWIAGITEKVNPSAHVIFVSSTSVYPDLSRRVFEGDESADAGGAAAALLDAESSVRERFEKHTILRFGGLYGYDRQPARFFAGRRNIPGGLNPVNMIHLDDAIGVLLWTISDGITGVTFNACAPKHPSRSEFYGVWAARSGIDALGFVRNETDHKQVSPQRLLDLGYTFIHADPLMPAP